MKRIWNAIGKQTKDAAYQQKAIRHVEQMEKGNVKVNAPHYEAEKAHFDKALKDEKLKKMVSEKDATLVDNMNKFQIKSTDPPERWTSTKELPTRESEWLHRNDPAWEFGFYEPPVERIPKNKLTFREALEVLRAKQELEDDGDSPASAARRQTAQDFLDKHAAIARVDQDQINRVFEFFRPFERKDKQTVVSKAELAQLQDLLKGHGDQQRLADGARDNMRKLLEKNKKAVEEYDRLEASEKDEFREAVKELRTEEHTRLQKRLEEIHKMEGDFQKAATEAMEAHEKDRKDKDTGSSESESKERK